MMKQEGLEYKLVACQIDYLRFSKLRRCHNTSEPPHVGTHLHGYKFTIQRFNDSTTIFANNVTAVNGARDRCAPFS